MKKQINPTIKAHLIRGAFYLLLLLAVWAIPFALAQRNVKRSASSPAAAAKAALAAAEVQRNPDTANQAQVPLRNPALQGTAFTNAYGVASLFGHHTAVGKHASVIGNTPHNPPLPYVIDDGTAEDSVGPTTGGSFVAVNSFPVFAGNNVITSISIAWGTPLFPDPSLDGLTYTAVLWSDPNGDGSPTDAVVLATAPGVISMQGTNTFLTSFIPPTTVTTPKFFVGFIITNAAGQFPAAFDETLQTLPNRSWIAQTSNINDLSGAVTIESQGLVGNWLIRAEGQEPPCIVANGDFETGSLPPWVNTGDTSNTSVSPGGHFGIFSLQSGPTSSDGFVDQVLPTTAGTAYDVYFWLLNGDSSGNNRFGASFGSVTLVPEASQGQFGWTSYTFTNVIPGANADLHFIFYNPTNLFLLDQVCVALSGGPSVTPTPTPTVTGRTPSPTPTVTPTATSGPITLIARGYKVQGQQRVDLSWNGATSNNIDIYRNGVLVATVPNIPGFYTDNIGARGKGTYTYRLCDAGTQNCSNQVTVKFGGG